MVLPELGAQPVRKGHMFFFFSPVLAAFIFSCEPLDV